MTVDSVMKRDGAVVPFDRQRIEQAIYAAARASGDGVGRTWAETLSWAVTGLLEERTNGSEGVPHVEEIQDIVEEVLVKSGKPRIAKAYILYRQQRAQARQTTRMLLDSEKLVDDYLQRADWRVNENSNMNYSLQGLNFYVASSIAARYWLHRIYPPEVQAAHTGADLHIHDLGMLSVYCCGWDLQVLLDRGFGGVTAKTESKPARHFRTALGQLVNFFYTMQGESAGAVAVSSFDTLLAPFVRYDGLDYTQVKQAMQEFMFNINVPTRVGFQSLVWDELVVVRRRGRIEVLEIGELVDAQFERNRHRVLTQGEGSFAVANADEVEALAFGEDGEVIWAPVKAYIRHQVPDRSTFVRVQTSRGAASVSRAHSLFAFTAMDGTFQIRPQAAQNAQIASSHSRIDPHNHFVAVRGAPNHGERRSLNLVELIDTVPQVAARARVRLPDVAAAIDRLRERIITVYGGYTPFYLTYGIKNKDCWEEWVASQSLPYSVWRDFGEDESEAEFSLHSTARWYPRMLRTSSLDAFVDLLAWYIRAGHPDITGGLHISQARGVNQEEMVQAMGVSSAPGHTTAGELEVSPGNPPQPVLKMAGKGLLAALVGQLGGTHSTTKAIPWFIYDLDPALQSRFIEMLLQSDGAESDADFEYRTPSKKLSLGLSLLLAMHRREFSVYEARHGSASVRDEYMLRVGKRVEAAERYAVGDLAAGVCLDRTAFEYDRPFEYDLSVDTSLENFAGGSGLLCFHNTPFTNLTMDLMPHPMLRDQPVMIGGKTFDATYGEYQSEMDLINRAFAEVMLEGDAKGRVFTFPIPTYNVTRDFDWENPALAPIWAMTARYGIPYFANFINSEMSPEDARSMCCRLRLDNRELRQRTGGLFAAAPLTGSVGVVTMNLARLGYTARNERDFREQLERLMEIAKTSLEIKRKMLESLTGRGLYPYSRYYLADIRMATGGYWSNHFSTIGINGMHEACLNFLGVGIDHPDGQDFALRTLHFMREVLARFQEETGNLYNLEATPAEGATFRLARADQERYPDILTAGTSTSPYYTNSTHLPVDYSDDLFEVLDHQDDLQSLYTGGTVLHIYLGEQIDDWRQARRLVRAVAEDYRLPYYTLTPTFSICPVHGYIAGEHRYCPHDHTPEELAQYGVSVSGEVVPDTTQ